MFTLRLLELKDAEALLAFYERNCEHLKPWIPSLPYDFHTIEYQRRRLGAYLERTKLSEEFRFGVFDSEVMAASINMTSIEYGAFMNGRLGYSMDAAYVRRGLATKYIGHVCEFGFFQVGLHRLEANVMPRNIASKRVLEKCGFQKVGSSPQMIQIAGAWEDHEMYARLTPRV